MELTGREAGIDGDDDEMMMMVTLELQWIMMGSSLVVRKDEMNVGSGRKTELLCRRCGSYGESLEVIRHQRT